MFFLTWLLLWNFVQYFPKCKLYLCRDSSTKDAFTLNPERERTGKIQIEVQIYTNLTINHHKYNIHHLIPGLRYMRAATSNDVWLK